jgi:hypothetical protein
VIRTECDFIEGVVDVGDHALFITLHSGKRDPGVERAMFDLFTRALELKTAS